MKYVTAKGQKLSLFSLGAVQLGMTYGLSAHNEKPSEHDAFALLDRAMELGMKIEAGMVHINDLTYLSSTTAPCGGWKESGVGREGGQFSMDDYTELKWLTFQSNRTW